MNLTDAGVEAGVCFEDVVRREVDSVAGKAEAAPDGGFWMQLRDGCSLGRGAGSCRGGAHKNKCLLFTHKLFSFTWFCLI